MKASTASHFAYVASLIRWSCHSIHARGSTETSLRELYVCPDCGHFLETCRSHARAPWPKTIRAPGCIKLVHCIFYQKPKASPES